MEIRKRGCVLDFPEDWIPKVMIGCAFLLSFHLFLWKKNIPTKKFKRKIVIIKFIINMTSTHNLINCLLNSFTYVNKFLRVFVTHAHICLYKFMQVVCKISMKRVSKWGYFEPKIYVPQTLVKWNHTCAEKWGATTFLLQNILAHDRGGTRKFSLWSLLCKIVFFEGHM